MKLYEKGTYAQVFRDLANITTKPERFFPDFQNCESLHLNQN